MIGGHGPREFSESPLTGYKIAIPMISASGGQTAFTGVAVGKKHVYHAQDKAVCLNDSKHAAPHAVCKCGFYCLNTHDAARDLTCTPENRDTVVLEVAVSGRYRRHELGLRFETQRVRKVWTGRCRCGRASEVFNDSGDGCQGWRQLRACCRDCADSRPVLTLPKFAELTGQKDLVAEVDRQPLSNFVTAEAVALDGAAHIGAPLVDAELAVINARIDELHRDVERLLHDK